MHSGHIRQLITRRTSAGAHLSFATIVYAAVNDKRARVSAADRVHLTTCAQCAAKLSCVQALIGGASAKDTDSSLPTPRLLDTLNGLRVTSVLASWLGPDTASALLRDARTGPHAKADVLAAVAHPLTAFLGEQAGSALALQISRLAESDRQSPWELHG